jgi:uncharacterized protein (TIGR03437 family)
MNGDLLPTTLGDVRVLVDNSPAPLWYVSATQISFLVASTEIPGTSVVQPVFLAPAPSPPLVSSVATVTAGQ